KDVGIALQLWIAAKGSLQLGVGDLLALSQLPKPLNSQMREMVSDKAFLVTVHGFLLSGDRCGAGRCRAERSRALRRGAARSGAESWLYSLCHVSLVILNRPL